MGSERKVAVVTGASQSTGAALFNACRDRNYRVTTTARSTFFADWIPVVATGAAFFMIVLDTSIVNVALARIGTGLNSSLATLQWLVDGYALVFASLLLGAGALGDRFGAKGTFMCGLLVFTLASALCGWLPASRCCRFRASCRGSGPRCFCRTPWPR
jgi:MFS family permease